MANYEWPAADKRSLIGKRISRVDGPQKTTGRAKYTYDQNPRGMLYGKIVRSPHAHAKIVSIDTSAAEKHPGVKAVELMTEPGKEIFWAGDELVALAAVDETSAEDAARLVKIQYEVLPHFVSDAEPPADVPVGGPLSENEIRSMVTTLQVPVGQVVSRVQSDGITFTPKEEDLEQAKKNGMPDALIDAIRKAKVVPPGKGGTYKKVAAQTQGDPDKGFSESEVVSEGIYGSPVITHCCLESHGAMSEWPDPEHLFVHISTQNVSGIPGQMSEPLKMPATNIRVHQDHVGGGFGSKFSVDSWGIVSAKLSKKAGGKPVKIMLDRRAELEVAGARPSAYARVKVGAKKDGTLVAWEHSGWGTGGVGGGGAPPLPYIVNVPNQKKQHTAISNNIGSARAWRAPNHPQAAVITMGALEDLAAKLNMDPVDFFLKNIELTSPRAKIYAEEIRKGDELIGWKKNWRPRGESPGPVKRGLGMSIHTWGGRGHNSECDFTINPDGSVSVKLGSQDLGTGTRTCIQMVAADSLGVPFDAVKVELGDTQYPPSGGSGGSTTIGGVSSSTRRGAIDALNQLFAKVAPALNAKPEELEAVNGTVRVASDTKRSLPWKQACAKLGAMPVTARGVNKSGMTPDLTNSGVGGVQMADVSVDTETGIVKVNKMVAVQDCGLVIDLKTAESQVYGALIMGIAYSLYEEKIMDEQTGRMLNANMEFYRLTGIGDFGELVVHMMTGPGYDERGVIGLAEPPTVSPGAAISNAVANAIGVRVPFLPLTPDRVLAALEGKEARRAAL
ncbi:MAG TPA: xanthine dehydrogenase family protein molybdopterin-binding subunit [Thermoanaerobaculia bacterium]|nr:xanthine dehydrogenase family protein molybdopterin-binding subunit [Thermoanaerobaculia bacterium]